jgi:hypothetical protein
MARKISMVILSLFILITGITGFVKLGYWNRSAGIFGYNQSGSFAGRGGRGGEFREGSGRRMDFHNGEGRVRNVHGQPGVSDTLTARMEFRNRENYLRRDTVSQHAAGGFSRSMPNGFGGRHGREGFRGGEKVNLSSVSWFLAVFALFAVITIYLDQVISIFRKRRKTATRHNSEC